MIKNRIKQIEKIADKVIDGELPIFVFMEGKDKIAIVKTDLAVYLFEKYNTPYVDSLINHNCIVIDADAEVIDKIDGCNLTFKGTPQIMIIMDWICEGGHFRMPINLMKFTDGE